MERDVEKEKEWKEVRARNEERKDKKTDRQTDTEWIRKPWLVLINTKRLIAAALVSSANTCPLWGRILERNLFPIIYCCWPMHQKKREKTQAVLNTVSIFQCLLQLSCPSSPSPIWTIVLRKLYLWSPNNHSDNNNNKTDNSNRCPTPLVLDNW